MKQTKVYLITVAILISLVTYAQDKQAKLIVMITIDGLRGDLLDRYDKAFTGGLRRLKDQGFSFTNAWVNHGITVSHAGHVSLATGMNPKNHGIVDAAFYEKNKEGKYIFTDAFQDSLYTLVGLPSQKSISPKKVLATGLAEWVKLINPSARSLCVGTGNISAALYCFKPHNEVYWYNGNAGGYVTSTFYQSSYPDWIKQFNNVQLSEFKRASAVWNTSVPPAYQSLAYPDTLRYESYGRFNSFPHILFNEAGGTIKDTMKALGFWLGGTPYADIATLKLAETGIEALQLGQRAPIDFLAIVLSQIDNNSHYYGPFSQETFDALVKIDSALTSFFHLLDTKVGKDQYIVALSSDHGFPDIPELNKEKGLGGRRITEDEIELTMNAVSQVLRSQGTTAKGIKQVKKILEATDFIAQVYTPGALNRKNRDEPLAIYQNSYRPDRVPRLPFFSLRTFQSPIAEMGMMVRLKENTMIDLDVVIHGSSYPYDRHVPMIFMGTGIKNGSSAKLVATIDVAPTLASLAGMIVFRNQEDGRPLFPFKED